MLTSDEQMRTNEMKASGAMWFLVALMLTMDRQIHGNVAAPSWEVYRDVVNDLTALYGPQDYKPI